MKKIIYVLFLGVVLSWSMPGLKAWASQNNGNAEEDMIMNKYLIPLLDAFKNKDLKMMYELWVEQPVTDENDEFFEQFFEQWNGRAWSSIEKQGEKKRAAKDPAPSAVEYYYLVMCGNEEVDIAIGISDTRGKIDSIKFQCDTQQLTGTLDTWRQFNLAQWLFTGTAAAEIVLTLFMAVLCIKRRNRLWGLWLFFILFFYAGIAFLIQDDFIVSFYIRTLALPKLLMIQGEGMKAYVSLPIGAIMYYIVYIRKKHIQGLENQESDE